MIRILQIGLSFNPGGIENCIVNYHRHIDKTQFCFDYVDIYGCGIAYAKEIEVLGSNIYTLPNFKRHPINMAKELFELMEQQLYDVIHINMLSAANYIPSTVACKSGKAVVIVHCHNSSIPSEMLRKVMHKINLNNLRNMPVTKCGCSIKAGKWMWGDTFDELNVIPNAVDTNKFKKNDVTRARIRSICGFTDDELVVGFVGRFCEQKNVLFIPEILSALKKKSSKYKLLLVGDGELRKKMLIKLTELGVKNDVYFAGIQNNTNVWYQAMDAFLLPSIYEGLPIVGIEAQVTGLPCFISDKVTDEVDITGTVQYLPIHLGGDIWADAVDRTLQVKNRKTVAIPQKYQIQYAVKDLEKRYMELIVRR